MPRMSAASRREEVASGRGTKGPNLYLPRGWGGRDTQVNGEGDAQLKP